MNKRILPRGKTIRRAATLLLALALLLGLTPAALAAVGTGWDDDCRGNPSGDGFGKHKWVKEWEDPTGCTTPMYVGFVNIIKCANIESIHFLYTLQTRQCCAIMHYQ